MSSADFITRKEFEERLRELSAGVDAKISANASTLSEALGMLKANQGQLTDLIANQSEMQKTQARLDKSVAIASTMNKVLWPVVTVLVSAVTALLTLVLHP
jgi:hypothetical protein